MKSFKLICVLLFILTISISNQRNRSQNKDYQVFYDVLHEKEGLIDLHTDKDSIEIYFNQLEAELDQAFTLQENFKLYSSTLRKLKCGHTQIYPNRKVFNEMLAERNSLPIDYYLEGKKLLFNQLDPRDYPTSFASNFNRNQILGIPDKSEIIEINHRSVDEMMQLIGNYISSDEDQIGFKYHQASHLFEFYRHLSDPFSNDTIPVKYLKRNDTIEINLIRGSAPVHTMNKRIADYTVKLSSFETEYGEFKIIRSKYGYFRFHSFVACGGPSYRDFLERSFKSMKDKNIDKLVIDVRGNTGGVMQYEFMSYFLGADVNLGRYVVEKPTFKTKNKYIKKLGFDYIRHWQMSRKQRYMSRRGLFNDGVIKTKAKDSTLIFKGDVIVVTDEGTFSSASMLACHLKSLVNAKIIGRPAGGSFYKGNSGTLEVTLPKSGFVLFVNPNTYYSQLKQSDDPFKIKEPDLYLDPQILNDRKLDAYYFKKATQLFKEK